MNAIGLSLPPMAFMDDQSDNSVLQFLTSVGGTSKLLYSLSDIGITHIELRSVDPHANVGICDRIYRLLQSYGFGMTVHSSLDDISGDQFLKSLPNNPVGDVIVVVHADKTTQNREKNYRLTIEQLSRFHLFAQNSGYPLKLMLEINRRKGNIDPGDNWKDVLNMATLSDIAGICFDFGHFYYNMKHFSDNQFYIPPSKELRFTGHTHIHGLVNDVTHFPLCETSLPLESYVDSLHSAEYRGIYNLEIAYSRLAYKDDPLGALKSSFKRLTNAINESSIPTQVGKQFKDVAVLQKSEVTT